MKIQILVVGRHEEILNTLLRIINKNEDWVGQGTLSDEEAIKLFDSNDFDIVLLSSGISENCEESLCQYFRDKKNDIKIIQHYGGGSGLLSNEILQAMNGPGTLQHNQA
jgi:DNA-binding NarL/FixJ family response regulator